MATIHDLTFPTFPTFPRSAWRTVPGDMTTIVELYGVPLPAGIKNMSCTHSSYTGRTHFAWFNQNKLEEAILEPEDDPYTWAIAVAVAMRLSQS